MVGKLLLVLLTSCLVSSNLIRSPILIAILLKNEEHSLPYFLGQLEALDYPKKLLKIWFITDNNVDSTTKILQTWKSQSETSYAGIFLLEDYFSSNTADIDDKLEDQPIVHFIKLRQLILNQSRMSNVTHLFMLDADVFLAENTLQKLLEQKKPLVAPLLSAVKSLYSNFWGAMGDDGYYQRSGDYEDILNREKSGLLQVPLVHSAMLIDLMDPVTSGLAYSPPPLGYNGPVDDIIIFAASCRATGVKMYLLNDEDYGCILPQFETLEKEKEDLLFTLTHYIAHDNPIRKSSLLPVQVPTVASLGLDKIFVINLERRIERRQKMIDLLHVLNLEAEFFKAVDGKLLNDSYLKQIGVRQMDGYEDPYHKRNLKHGEIGCFLSHYTIWQRMLENNLPRVMVLEDDVYFHGHFKPRLLLLLQQADQLVPDWDLIYLGRKRMGDIEEESWLEGSDQLIWPTYSYWTVGYVISIRGAQKLVGQGPLAKMVAIDEYLPVMFDRHPNEQWKSKFYPRNLVTFSAHPLLIEPWFYVGQDTYQTDTEDSAIFDTPHGGQERPIDTVPVSSFGLAGAGPKDEL